MPSKSAAKSTKPNVRVGKKNLTKFFAENKNHIIVNIKTAKTKRTKL